MPLALLGAREGPLVCINRIRDPFVRVSGLPKGAVLVVTIYSASGAPHVRLIDANGDHSINAGEWLQMTYEGPPNHRTICNVLRRKAA